MSSTKQSGYEFIYKSPLTGTEVKGIVWEGHGDFIKSTNGLYYSRSEITITSNKIIEDLPPYLWLA